MREKLGVGNTKAPSNTGALVTRPTATTGIATQLPQTQQTDVRTNPKQNIGYTGIAFPFSFSPTGGVATSTTSNTDVSHISESVYQILFTRFRERFFNATFGSSFRGLVFESLNEVDAILQSEIQDDLERQEKRIKIQTISVSPNPQAYSVSITLFYQVTVTSPPTNVRQDVILNRAA